jgi:Clostripain family
MLKKTIIVNIVAVISNEHTPFLGFKEMIKEYISDGKSSHVEIFFIYVSQINNKTKSKVYELKYGILGWFLEEHLKNEGKLIDVGNPKILTKIFDYIISEERKDYNKILATYSHGTGFNIITKNMSKDDVIKTNFQDVKASFIDIFFNIKKFTQSVETRNDTLSSAFGQLKESFKETITTLTMDELSLSITKSKYAKNFDLILLANCFMNTMDTIYALRHCTKYLISSETTFTWQGYDYSLLSRINMGINETFLNPFLYFSFLKINDLKRGYPDGNISKDEMLLSLFDYTKSNIFFDTFDKIVIFLLNELQYFKEYLFTAAKKCSDLTGFVQNGIRDLFSFLNYTAELLKAHENEPNTKKFISFLVDLKEEYTKILVTNEAGTSINVASSTHSGISINFPVLAEEKTGHFEFFTSPTVLNSKAVNNKFQSMFARNSKWGELISKIVEHKNI